MYALPAAAAPPPRRQVLVGTALASMATIMLVGGMLAIWILQRERARDAGGTWLPEGTTIPEVPANVMLIGVWSLCVFAQWAVYSARRADRAHTALALGIVGLMTLALINAQAYVYAQMELPIADGGYAGMFYAITGTMVALFVVGLVFSAISAFRFLGGRIADREIIAANALYWYVLATVFSAVWLIVYVAK
ncbi:MAG: cytochrome c oxidase subunit 3 [Ilumatobacteraceae bacterium]